MSIICVITFRYLIYTLWVVEFRVFLFQSICFWAPREVKLNFRNSMNKIVAVLKQLRKILITLSAFIYNTAYVTAERSELIMASHQEERANMIGYWRKF